MYSINRIPLIISISFAIFAHHTLSQDFAAPPPTPTSVSSDIVTVDPNAYRSFKEICEENGFKYEEHLVTTSDGYILKVFRIPGLASEGANKPGKPVILFQHGILDSADCWLAHHASVAPAFLAVRAGYDAWFGNSRGTKYSHAHVNPDISNHDYWDFSFDTMGELDLPPTIDYVLKQTSHQKLTFIGHSQGTTQMFYALATNEAFFAERVNVFISLGSVLQMNSCKSKLLYFMGIHDKLLLDTTDLLGINEIFPANWLVTGSMRLICGAIPQICEFGTYLIVDEDLSLDDASSLQVHMSHFPSGTSMRCLAHYGQIMQSRVFQRYDYLSESSNLQAYGQTMPPVIQLSNIKTVPIAMFIGTRDELATTQDNRWARDQIGDAVAFYREYNMGHLSFLVGNDMAYFTTDVMNILS